MTTKDEVMQVLELTKQGLSNKEMAEKMGWKMRKLDYYIMRLKKAGYEVPSRRGRKPLEL